VADVILLTGTDGFVGSAVRDAALRRGAEVRAGSRRQNAAGDRLFVDVLRPETLTPAMDGVSTVIHAAGAAHLFRRTPAEEASMVRTNVEGTRNVVLAARRAGVRHVVLVSSVSVYGDMRDAYARSKADAERAAIEAAAGAMTLTTLRLATVYGEGDPGNVARLVRAIDRHAFVWIGHGENRKSLIHRDDAGAAIVAAALAGVGGTFNVSAQPVTMRDVVTTIARLLGRMVPRLPIGSRTAISAARAMKMLTLNNRRAAALERAIAKWCSDEAHDASDFNARFGFVPAVDFTDGMAREVAWYLRSRGR
jgi:nucleoside-diphosphate-sugar epimerase